jgi:6-phosphogluconolactonase/glucosamine-6-phosphate isomerase/deaminase
MQFYRADVSSGVGQLSELISQSLERHQPLLWLVSGGSNIPIAIKVMSALVSKDLSNLTIMLTDERYGALGHADSNAYQLQAAGFNPQAASFIPVLIGKSLKATVERYANVVEQQFGQHQVIIGQLGIGTDGHTAGILPNSLAADVTDELVTSYAADDFSRITMTFPALRHLTNAFVFAYGPTKQATLNQLKDEVLPLKAQPAQILKAIPDTYIYNEGLEGEA